LPLLVSRISGTPDGVVNSGFSAIITGDYSDNAAKGNLKTSVKYRWKLFAWLLGLLLTIAFVMQLIQLKLLGQYTSDVTNSFLCNKNPYIASLNTSLNSIETQAQNWLNQMDLHLLEAKKPSMLQHTHDRFFPFQPMSGCHLTCIGGACGKDESKIMCGTEQLQSNKQCVIYSVGGNNMWGFELDVLNRTSCEIHTFDCTGSRSRFHKPDNNRLTFHHVCLGAVSQPAPEKECTNEGRKTICGPIMTLKEIQSMLGHTQIDLLKFDIEGYEWPIFESWPEISDSSSSSFVYPMQILVEIHYQTQFPDLWLPKQASAHEDFRFATDIVRLQSHFLRMGYAVIVRDDNRFCKHCSELTLLRFKCH
jgi:hypothetical protein